MNTEISLAAAMRSGVTLDSREFHGTRTNTTADRTLPSSISTTVSLTNFQTCLPYTFPVSRSTVRKCSSPAGLGNGVTAQDSPSVPEVNAANDFLRSSQRMIKGTPRTIKSNKIAYLASAIPNGSAAKVIMMTTKLKLGELNKKPRATSTLPLPRVIPQATGTEQLAQTPAGMPMSAPL